MDVWDLSCCMYFLCFAAQGEAKVPSPHTACFRSHRPLISSWAFADLTRLGIFAIQSSPLSWVRFIVQRPYVFSQVALHSGGATMLWKSGGVAPSFNLSPLSYICLPGTSGGVLIEVHRSSFAPLPLHTFVSLICPVRSRRSLSLSVSSLLSLIQL